MIINYIGIQSKGKIPFNQLDIEEKIRLEVLKKQVRAKDFFTDFDTLRKGLVTEDKFRSALSMLYKLFLSEDDIKIILGRYKQGEEYSF